jgi:Ni,Fe-hydrogenase maturation factor
MIHKERFPSDVGVYLIEAGSLDYGLDLTPEVRAAAERVVSIIADELRR